jgi:TRAP-type C4-dicarboxylate transport system substrate-binding protein
VKRTLLACVVAITLVSLVIGGCTTPAAPTPSTPAPTTPGPSTPAPSTPPKTVTLKATFYQPATHTSVINFKDAFANIETMTEGRVKVDVYDSQTLVKMPETFDALNRGIADMTQVPLPPLRLDIPWWGVEMLPGLFKDRKGMHDAAAGGILDMYQEAVHSAGLKIKVVEIFCPGVTHIMTKGKRVAAPADVKGLKIAAGDAPSANVVEVLGGAPVVMGFPETYEAILRGMVDGALGNTSSLSQYNQQEPCDYRCMQSFGGPYVAVLLSEGALEQLSEADGAIVISLLEKNSLLEELGFAIGEQRMISDIIAPELKEVVYPSPEQSQLWQDAVAPLIDGWLAQAGPDGQKAVDIMRQYNP